MRLETSTSELTITYLKLPIVNNRNTRTKFEIYPKLTIKKPE